MKKKILNLLSKSDPLKSAEIAEHLKADTKEVAKIIKEMKVKNEILVVKRCYYTVKKTLEKLSVNKKEFIDLLKKKHHFKTKKEAENGLNAVIHLVEELLTKGKEVGFTGWGKFKLSKREKRDGRNPQTGKKITIPAKTVIKFKVGKKLGEKVNK